VIQQALAQVLDGRDLSRDDARESMNTIMRGEATQAQIAGFLVALRAKGETADEIAGCAEAMREHVLAVNPKRTDLVDIVGTGGDGARNSEKKKQNTANTQKKNKNTKKPQKKQKQGCEKKKKKQKKKTHRR